MAPCVPWNRRATVRSHMLSGLRDAGRARGSWSAHSLFEKSNSAVRAHGRSGGLALPGFSGGCSNQTCGTSKEVKSPKAMKPWGREHTDSLGPRLTPAAIGVDVLWILFAHNGNDLFLS